MAQLDGRTYVWVVEEGDYEQRGVWYVAESPEAAWDAVKAGFPTPPYIVAWADPVMTSETEGYLMGDFARVSGYSVEHKARFDATRYALKES